jgi:hypothetical protein
MRTRIAWLSALLVGVLLVALPFSPVAARPSVRTSCANNRTVSTPAGSNYSSPCIADIDADGKDEIICGTGNALACYDCAGNQRWIRDTGGRCSSSPAAWDMNGDGKMEIYVGNESALVLGYDCNGNDLPGWPKSLPPARACSETGCFSSPAIGDINGDGMMEIVIGCWGMRVWAFNWIGGVVPGFPVDVKDTIWSSPAIGDVNGDGRNEIVIGADCTAGQGWPYPSGGLLFVLNGAGQNVPGFPKWTPQVIWSSPALGDLNNDGVLDIVVGTGLYYQDAGGTCLYGWDGAGNNLPGWPVEVGYYSMTSPALGDVNNDGRLEVAYSHAVYDSRGVQVSSTNGYIINSPALGDTNGDGNCEVEWANGSAPALGDIDGDGLVEIVKCPNIVTQTNVKFNAALFPWPMFRHDSRRSGVFDNSRPPTPKPNYETYVLLQNPQEQAATATLQFMMGNGETAGTTVPLAPHSRSTVLVNDVVGFGKNVSTKVSCDVPITAERAVYFNSSGRTDGSDSIGAAEPSTEWYLAEGYTGGKFDTWILVQNPGDSQADVVVSLMKDDGSVVPVGMHMPASSRQTLHVDEVPGCASCDVSAKVTSPVPVVAERAMYFDYYGMNGGHDSIGVTEPLNEWYMAEGCTGWGFDTYVLVMNPGDEAAGVTYTVMTDDGRNIDHYEAVGPHSRKTVMIDKLPGLGGCSFSVRVTSDHPVVAERAMYFNNNGRNGGHESVAAAGPASEWYLPEGYTGESFDEWITIQNPADGPLGVRATFMRPGGATTVKEYEVAPRARYTIHVDDIPGLESTEVSTTLESTNSVKFVAERSMYFNYKGVWDGGHNTIGLTAPSKTWYFAEGYTGQ